MPTVTLPRPMDEYIDALDGIAENYKETADEVDVDNSETRAEGDIIAGLAEWVRGGATGPLVRPYPVYHAILLRQIGDDIVVANHPSTGDDAPAFLDAAQLLVEFVNWMLDERPFDRKRETRR